MDLDSLNPYQSLAAIVGDNPDELIMNLRSIKTPIKIVQIVPYGTKQVAYIMGDIRLPNQSKLTKNKREK